MDYFSRGYSALRGPTGAPQSATETIDKLCERLLNGSQLEDRRAALLGLKGLSRDWKSDVGSRALPILLGVLQEDAPEDTETAKAVVETLSLLCEVEEVDGRPVRDDSGLRNTDVFLATPTPLHTLLSLLTPTHFYLRFFSLQLFGVLLANRSNLVQTHVLTAAGGIGRLVEALDDAREIIRNEALLLIIALTTSNADIQKLLAFEGAFDKLFQIIRQEGGIGGGGIVVQDCLAAIAGLLRWNVSNQNYFRETSCIPLLTPLLLFPKMADLTPQSLAAFAFQSWSEQKVINANLVISLIRMLVGGGGKESAGNQKALLKSGATRCLTELALASNAPAVVKSQALNALADIMNKSKPNQEEFATFTVTPLLPPPTPSLPERRGSTDDVPGSSRPPPSEVYDNRWHRGSPASATTAVVNLAVNGDGTPGRDGLRVRAGAASLFEAFVAYNESVAAGIIATMSTPQPEANPNDTEAPSLSAGSIIIQAIRAFPATRVGEPFDSYTVFFGCLLFSHVLLNAQSGKEKSLQIYFTGDDAQPGGGGDEDDRASLVVVIVGNLMMAQREHAQSANAGAGTERGLEWSRVMVAYLIVLTTWLWESPLAVKEFLSEGSNVQVLIQPITQSSGVDSVVQGLCAFLLGICYEYNREPGPITRETLHPILQSRVGPDQFVSRILRLREDPRFRAVAPNVLEMIDEEEGVEELGEMAGLWFDYAFVDLLKTNYIAVQRSILLDPDATDGSRRSMEHGGESSEVVAQLRATIVAQTKEIDTLKDRLRGGDDDRKDERDNYKKEMATLTEKVQTLTAEADAAKAEATALREKVAEFEASKGDVEKEQEDLLVLLEEISGKRKADKVKMRGAGLEVSDDEDEEDDDE